ncbi:MAG: hypothetical protein IJG13_18620, partial [Kiritimatiellae bacterium]|nr:hypothetical protein [Kiritimatiellia bacterium]
MRAEVVAVVGERLDVVVVRNPVVVPVVGVDAAVDANKVVAPDGESAVAAEGNLRVGLPVRVAAGEEPLPRYRPLVAVRKEPQPALSLHCERVAEPGGRREARVPGRVLKTSV